MRLIPNHGYLPVTLEDAQRAGRDRAWHDASTQFVKSAAKVLAQRSTEIGIDHPIHKIVGELPRIRKLEDRYGPDDGRYLEAYADEVDKRIKAPGKLKKLAAEGDIGAILSGAIANKFGTRAALNELAQTEDSKREPAVTDPQEDLPQLPSGRSITTEQIPGRLMEADAAIDRMRQVYGLSKKAFAISPAKLLGGAVGRVGEAVTGASRRAGRLFRRGGQRVTPQLATAEQMAHLRPMGTLPAAQAAQGGARTAPGHILPPGSTPAAPGGAGGPYRTPGTPTPEPVPVELSKKTKKLTEVEGVQQKQKRYKGPGLLGGAMIGTLGLGTAAALAKGVPAAGQALQNMTAYPMAYGMGYSNLPYGYGQQEYTNF